MSVETLFDVTWRLDMPIAARGNLSTSHAVVPTYTMNISSEQVVAPSDTVELREWWVSCDYNTLLNLSRAVDEAVDALKSPNVRRVVKMVR